MMNETNLPLANPRINAVCPVIPEPKKAEYDEKKNEWSNNKKEVSEPSSYPLAIFYVKGLIVRMLPIWKDPSLDLLATHLAAHA